MNQRHEGDCRACDAFSGLAQQQSGTQRILDTQPLTSSEIEFSFLNINLVVRVGALISLDEDAALEILADENLHEPITNARQHRRSKEILRDEARARSGRLASGGP